MHRIECRTPAAPTDMKKSIATFIVAAAECLSLTAQVLPPLPEMERILLPITVSNVPGAFRTVWSSQGSVFRDLDTPVLILPGCEQPCDNPNGPTARRTLPLDFPRTQPGDTNGTILYVERASSDQVFLSLRLLEALTGQSIQLPVVRERFFFSHKFQILDVPNPGSGTRITLRLYGIDPNVLGRIEVRVYVQGSEQLVQDAVYDLTVVQRLYSTLAYTLPVRPPTAEVSYYSPIAATSDLLRFEVVPLTSAMPVWGFVSVTDNLTQRVTLRTPH